MEKLMKFKKGNRVKIHSYYNWPNSCYGTISEPPVEVCQLFIEDAPWNGCHRSVKGRQEIIEFVWVEFDEPQYDGDGDGPYNGGEVEVRYLISSL
jgi:hypothetical protein